MDCPTARGRLAFRQYEEVLTCPPRTTPQSAPTLAGGGTGLGLFSARPSYALHVACLHDACSSQLRERLLVSWEALSPCSRSRTLVRRSPLTYQCVFLVKRRRRTLQRALQPTWQPSRLRRSSRGSAQPALRLRRCGAAARNPPAEPRAHCSIAAASTCWSRCVVQCCFALTFALTAPVIDFATRTTSSSTCASFHGYFI